MPNSTTSSSRPSSKFLDRTLLGAKDADRRGVMMIESECRSFFPSRDEVNCVPVCFRTHIETKTCVNCGLEYHSYVVDDEGKAVFVTVKTPEGVLIDELGVRYSAIPRGEE